MWAEILLNSLSTVVLHGAVGVFDELMLFGGAGVLVLALLIVPRLVRRGKARRKRGAREMKDGKH